MLLHPLRLQDALGPAALALVMSTLGVAAALAWPCEETAQDLAPLVMAHKAQLKKCVALEELRSHQRVHTTLWADVTVETDGCPTRVVIPNAEAFPELAVCVGEELSTWNYGPHHHLRVITVPLTLLTH